jgi:YHS domain-containing protein
MSKFSQKQHFSHGIVFGLLQGQIKRDSYLNLYNSLLTFFERCFMSSLIKKTMSVAVVIGLSSFALYAQGQTTPANQPATHDSMAVSPAKLAPQTTCPVMGEAINKSVYVDYNGKRVYFCCGMCPATFKKDPETYIKKLESMGQGVETVTTKKKETNVKGNSSGKKDSSGTMKGMDHSKM